MATIRAKTMKELCEKLIAHWDAHFARQKKKKSG